MNGYSLEEIIALWGKEELTMEQVIGQILLLIKALSERVGSLERRMETRRKNDGPSGRGKRPS